MNKPLRKPNTKKVPVVPVQFDKSELDKAYNEYMRKNAESPSRANVLG